MATPSTCWARSADPSRSIARSRHLLLIAGGLGMAGVRMLADEAIRDGRQVTLLFGATSAREVYPSNLLPDEVEYVVATDDGSLGHRGFVTELVPQFEGWADQAFACGPMPMLRALAGWPRAAGDDSASLRWGGSGEAVARTRGSPGARRKAFLQVSMEQNMGCAVGACLGCVVLGVAGTPQRVCREGPVFASEELAGGSLVVKAKRRVLTTSGRPTRAKRTPTIRRVRPAIVQATPRPRVETSKEASRRLRSRCRPTRPPATST